MIRIRNAIILTALLMFGASAALAQSTACSTLPVSGEGIECSQGDTSTENIAITAKGVDIKTTGVGAHGVSAFHEGNGKIDIRVKNASIKTTGVGARGVYGLHQGKGNIAIRVGNASIETTATYNGDTDPPRTHGIVGRHRGFGNIDIVASKVKVTTAGDYARAIYGVVLPTGREIPENAFSRMRIVATNPAITTSGVAAHGIMGWHERNNSRGNIEIIAKGGTITTGESAWGIAGLHQSTGNIFIDARDLTIRTSGDHGNAIFAKQEEFSGETNPGIGVGNVNIHAENLTLETSGLLSHGILGWKGRKSGDVRIDVLNTTVTTQSTKIYQNRGAHSHGVFGHHQGEGDLTIDIRGGSIATRGAHSHGVFGHHQGEGDLTIDIRGGSIATRGAYSYGVYGLHQGKGNIAIDTRDGHTIATTGENAHGIVAYHFGTADSRAISITTEGTVNVGITTEGTVNVGNAQGVRVGIVNAQGVPERVAGVDKKEGYRRQTVTVNGRVSSKGVGVYLAGGGRVVIGRRGRIDSNSRIAILATGTVPAPDPNPDKVGPILPKLRVDLNLGGRRVAQAIGDGWIINDGGETTIAVNGTVLHEGKTGVTDKVARNGAWNVRMRAEGVAIDRTDLPETWDATEPDTGVVTDRDFSAAKDFTQTARPRPSRPPPPREPEPEPEPPQRPMLDEAYAPRAALYELLPDFLLRLAGSGPSRVCRVVPDTPVWTRVAGGQGSYTSERSTTGATYDLERFETEGGLSAALTDRVRGWASVRYVRGTAGGASPTGGGAIDVRGLGSAVGGAWQGANDVYAVGCFSYMTYDVDFASTPEGALKVGVDGRSYALDLEVGRRFAVGAQWHLTPRVWVVGARVSVDDFTDAVDARVSLSDADRVLGGLGMLVETVRPWGEGAFSLRGSLDVERIVRGATTTTQVSGEPLSADATDHSLLVGLQGSYRQGRFTVGAEILARQELGSTDLEYTSFLNLGLSF